MARCEKLFPDPAGWGNLLCTRKAVAGKKFCWQHDPEYIRRQQEKRRLSHVEYMKEKEKFALLRAVRRIDDWLKDKKRTPDVWYWSILRKEILKENQ